MQGFCGAFILQNNPHAGIQKRQFAQALFQRVKVVIQIGKRAIRDVGFGRRQKPHHRAALPRGGTKRIDMGNAIAMFKPGAVFGVVAPDGQFQPFRQGIDHRNADTVQPAGHLVGIAALIGIVELTASVQLGHDDFGGGNAFFLVDADRDPTAIVMHGNRRIRVDFDAHKIGMSGQSLVNAVVHNLVHHMVQT